jgi:Predicted ATPase, RNase L inhibitor (RLI) homolog
VIGQQLTDCSGGERQRVAIVACLSQGIDLSLLDKLSAHLNVEQWVLAMSTIRRYADANNATALVSDHDTSMTEIQSDRVIIFDDTPVEAGRVAAPQGIRHGANAFLLISGITSRRDEPTNRSQLNKLESQLNRK